MIRIFEIITGILGWIQIVLSPTLICSLIGAMIYFYNPNKTRFIISICFALFGFIVGIVIATRIWKTNGTVAFISRASATPELESIQESENK